MTNVLNNFVKYSKLEVDFRIQPLTHFGRYSEHCVKSAKKSWQGSAPPPPFCLRNLATPSPPFLVPSSTHRVSSSLGDASAFKTLQELHISVGPMGRVEDSSRAWAHAATLMPSRPIGATVGKDLTIVGYQPNFQAPTSQVSQLLQTVAHRTTQLFLALFNKTC